MSSIVEEAHPWLEALVAYDPGKPIEETAREQGLDPTDIIKLASNENPLGPSPKAIEAMKRDWIPDDLHRRNGAGHAEVLAASPFCKVERMVGSVPRIWTADQVLGQLLSTSYFNPGRLGYRRAAFEADLRARLARVAPEGVFEENLGFLALVATRPTG